MISACIVGNWVTVGHSAIVHACTVGDEVLVGMGAVILDGAVIGRQSLIGAKALVTQGMKIPPGSLVLGAPAKVVRKLTPEGTRRTEMVGGKIRGQRRLLLETRNQCGRAVVRQKVSGATPETTREARVLPLELTP